MAQRLRHFVFLSPLALLLIGLVLSLVSTERFFEQAQGVVDWLLQHFDWLFSWSTFLFVLLVVAVYISPLGKQKIGGEEAKPILSRWRDPWYSTIFHQLETPHC